MKQEKHLENIREALDEIQSALQDPKGLNKHRIRLALILSSGAAEILELYLRRENIMKQGARIKHNWLDRSQKRVREKLEKQVTGDLERISKLDQIIELCRNIESERNDLAYGSPVSDEKKLKTLIDTFLEIKEKVEEETGDKIE